jgi:hypothetical protein
MYKIYGIGKEGSALSGCQVVERGLSKMARHVDTVVNQFLYKHEHNVPSCAGSISEMVVCGLEVLWQLGTSVPPAAVCSTLTAVTMLVKFPHHNLFFFTLC